MNASPQEQDWNDRLRTGLGTAPTPDFDAWCERHPDAIVALATQASQARLPSVHKRDIWRTAMRSIKWIAASLLVLSALIWSLGDSAWGPTVFADTIPGVDDVQTMSWTDIYYIRFTSEDGQRTWIQEDRRLTSYRSSGQYRETRVDKDGMPIAVQITDDRAGRMLTLDLKEKKAVLKLPATSRGDRAPFAWVGDIIRERKTGSESYRVKSVSLQGTKEFDKKQASVVRVLTRGVNGLADLRTDYFFDVESKQLVGICGEAGCESGSDSSYVHVPFDPETASDRNNPPEEGWSKMVPVGRVTQHIVVNGKLDQSEFSLDPPADYAFEKIAKPTVTEEEMLAFLGAAAKFNGNQFPDSISEPIDRDRFNAVSKKAEQHRTAAEQSLLDIRDKILMREIYQSPIKQFEDDQTARGSFHYIGSGVTVGQAEKIVGWYKLRGAGGYRAFYGDLSVKDVAASELPFNPMK